MCIRDSSASEEEILTNQKSCYIQEEVIQTGLFQLVNGKTALIVFIEENTEISPLILSVSFPIYSHNSYAYIVKSDTLRKSSFDLQINHIYNVSLDVYNWSHSSQRSQLLFIFYLNL